MKKLLKRIKVFFRRGNVIVIPPNEDSYALLLNKLKEGKPFSFSRWGDGEWEAVLHLKKEKHANCDGHQYFSSLNDALAAIVKRNPNYLFGMQRYAYDRLLGRKIDRFFKKHSISRDWLNADALHDASLRGRLTDFFELLTSKKVLLVGPQHLSSLQHFSFDLISIPEKNVWLKRDGVLDEVKRAFSAKNYDVILFCAGMTANWFVDELHDKCRAIILDIGSVLDPYVGIQSRNYHKQLLEKKMN